MFKNFKNPIFKQVFYFNLLYANPTITANAMKNKKYGDTPEDIFRGLLVKSYLMTSILISVVYTLVFLVLPLKMFPQILDYILLVFFLLSILQTFTHFFNVFYVSRDIESYMYLPIEEGLVYRAKMAAVAIATIQMAIPVWSISSIYGFNMGLGPISILYGFIDFILVGALVVIVNMVLMEALAKTSVLYKFKNGIITAINIVASVSNVGIIVFLQTSKARSFNISQLGGPAKYGFISGLLRSHMGNLLVIVALGLIIVVLYTLIMRTVNGRFYRYIRRIQEGPGQKKRPAKESMEAYNEKFIPKKDSDKTSVSLAEPSQRPGIASEDGQSKRKTKKGSSSLGFSFFKYNMGLINEPTVITQSIVMNCLMPVFMLLTNLLNSSGDGSLLESIRTNSGLASAVIAIVIALFSNAMSTSLPSMIVSLDRENYYYIKSLPISRKTYFISKLVFSASINSILPIVLMLGVFIYAGIPCFDIVFALVLFLVVSFSIASQWLIYDFKNVVTDWQNVSDIFGRINKAIILVVMFLIFIVYFMMMILFGFIASFGFGTHLRDLIAILALIFGIFSLTRVIHFINGSDY